MTSRRSRRFLLGLIRFLALVTVAGGIGVALGMVLTKVSDDKAPAGAVGGRTGTAAPPATAAAPGATTPTTPATTTITTTPTATPDPLDQVRLSVLDARLFTDDTPSGAREQRARVTVRIRAENAGGESVTLARPILRIGSVRIATDPDAEGLPGSRFAALRPGVAQTVTLRFSLAGEATPKVVRDRRARVLIAGRSLPMRVKLRAPAR